MVTGPNGRAGKGSGGCLFTLAVFGVVVWLGLPIGQVYIKQYSFEEEMRSQARLGPSLTDAVIRRRLLDKVDELSLPPEAAKNIKIKRTSGLDRRITIDSEYQVTVTNPLFSHTFVFRPHADLPL